MEYIYCWKCPKCQNYNPVVVVGLVEKMAGMKICEIETPVCYSCSKVIVEAH